MGKKIQVKFYTEQSRATRCEQLFGAQGLSLTEGFSRLIDLLDGVPDTMLPLLLKQAPGNAAMVLAEYTLTGRVAPQAVPDDGGRESQIASPTMPGKITKLDHGKEVPRRGQSPAKTKRTYPKMHL